MAKAFRMIMKAMINSPTYILAEIRLRLHLPVSQIVDMLHDHEWAVGYAHEYISPIWSTSVAMGRYTVPAIATPYCCNGNIINYVHFHPGADSLEFVCQIASTLAHIHSMDIVHGDICPVSLFPGRSVAGSGFYLLLTIGLAGKYMHH